MKARALVWFTLLAQMAVGAFWVLGSLYWRLAIYSSAQLAQRLLIPMLLAIGPLAVAAMLVSLLHLGSPQRAYRALVNWRASWLSREILFTLLFIGLGALFAGLETEQWGGSWLRLGTGLATGLCGLGLVYSMARLYMLRTVPVWNCLATGISFFTTAFLLGALGLAALLVARSLIPGQGLPSDLLRLALRWISSGALFVFAIELLVLTWNKTAYKDEIAGQVQRMGLRLGLVFAGTTLYAIRLAIFIPTFGWVMAGVAWLAFGLVLAGELIGRTDFYQLRKYSGL